jgi:hypothetical protein
MACVEPSYLYKETLVDRLIAGGKAVKSRVRLDLTPEAEDRSGRWPRS